MPSRRKGTAPRRVRTLPQQAAASGSAAAGNTEAEAAAQQQQGARQPGAAVAANGGRAEGDTAAADGAQRAQAGGTDAGASADAGGDANASANAANSAAAARQKLIWTAESFLGDKGALGDRCTPAGWQLELDELPAAVNLRMALWDIPVDDLEVFADYCLFQGGLDNVLAVDQCARETNRREGKQVYPVMGMRLMQKLRVEHVVRHLRDKDDKGGDVEAFSKALAELEETHKMEQEKSSLFFANEDEMESMDKVISMMQSMAKYWRSGKPKKVKKVQAMIGKDGILSIHDLKLHESAMDYLDRVEESLGPTFMQRVVEDAEAGAIPAGSALGKLLADSVSYTAKTDVAKTPSRATRTQVAKGLAVEPGAGLPENYKEAAAPPSFRPAEAPEAPEAAEEDVDMDDAGAAFDEPEPAAARNNKVSPSGRLVALKPKEGKTADALLEKYKGKGKAAAPAAAGKGKRKRGRLTKREKNAARHAREDPSMLDSDLDDEDWEEADEGRADAGQQEVTKLRSRVAEAGKGVEDPLEASRRVGSAVGRVRGRATAGKDEAGPSAPAEDIEDTDDEGNTEEEDGGRTRAKLASKDPAVIRPLRRAGRSPAAKKAKVAALATGNASGRRRWSEAETKILMDGLLQAAAAGAPTGPWAQISKDLGEAGAKRTGQQVREKWLNLCKFKEDELPAALKQARFFKPK